MKDQIITVHDIDMIKERKPVIFAEKLVVSFCRVIRFFTVVAQGAHQALGENALQCSSKL